MRIHSRSLAVRVRRLVVILMVVYPVLLTVRADAVAQLASAPTRGMHMLPTAACDSTLTFGATVLCSIDAAAEQDQYTLTASAGDQIKVRLSRTSGALQSRIRLYAPGDPPGGMVTLCDNVGTPTAEIISCALPKSGTYTLVVDDAQRTNTGGYMVYVQRLNNPGGGQSLSFGQTLTSTIGTLAELDTYTFDATVGDHIKVRMTRTTGTLSPRVQLFNAKGDHVCDAAYGSPTVELVACQLAGPGPYALFVDDTNRTAVGDYSLYMQRLNNPGAAPNLAYGQAVTNTLTMVAELDSYTFDANSNDRVKVRMTATAGDLHPRIQIYNANGDQVCDAQYGTPTAELVSCPLPTTGKYHLFVDDSFRTDTGSYRLYLQRLNNPGLAQPILFGQTLSNSIDVRAELDTYTFQGDANAQVSVRMTRSAGTVTPRIRVYTPAGDPLCSAEYGSPRGAATIRDLNSHMT